MSNLDEQSEENIEKNKPGSRDLILYTFMGNTFQK